MSNSGRGWGEDATRGGHSQYNDASFHSTWGRGRGRGRGGGGRGYEYGGLGHGHGANYHYNDQSPTQAGLPETPTAGFPASTRGRGAQSWRGRATHNDFSSSNTASRGGYERGRGGVRGSSTRGRMHGNQLRGNHGGSVSGQYGPPPVVLPMSSSADVPFLTQIPIDEQSAILSVIREKLVVPRELLGTYAGYHNVYIDKGLGMRRSDFGVDGVPADVKNRYTLPAADPSRPKRAFVVMDGEFIQVRFKEDPNPAGEKYMARLSVIDGLTGEKLLDNYCMPIMREASIISLLSKFKSGIFQPEVEAARARGEVYLGLARLNAAFATFADENTTIGTYAGHNDLFAQKLCAPTHVVDTQLLCAGLGGNKTPGLRACAASLLGVNIQSSTQHSAYEDACATRESILLKARELLAGAAAPVWKAQPPPAPKTAGGRNRRRRNSDYDLSESDDEDFVFWHLHGYPRPGSKDDV